ncbi:concanavalin A-like lectin/glucanase domain-containing protein [Artemisia annua]|uniref:Concanavalin A-like lectin/glucanase domain-containing protein n=1 Tax=Artemisia annua TaxID=35608 RepID=A0A2U1MYV4_ARTAN|nr:concanavalin A-like lectin/glucanase domain-containing protein [Artemisia annua]
MVFPCKCFSSLEEEIKIGTIIDTPKNTNESFYIAFSNLSKEPSNLRVFTFTELRTATNNFRMAWKDIGVEDGFGRVFRGVIKSLEHSFDDIEVTIKYTSGALQASLSPLVPFDLAEIIHAMMENNNNYQDIAEIIREATKKRKREHNLKNWNWSDVIDVDELPDEKQTADEDKTDDKTIVQEVTTSANNATVTDVPLPEHETNDDDVPMAPIKRKKKNQIKITGRNRLCRLFDEDSNEEAEHSEDDSEDDEWI